MWRVNHAGLLEEPRVHDIGLLRFSGSGDIVGYYGAVDAWSKEITISIPGLTIDFRSKTRHARYTLHFIVQAPFVNPVGRLHKSQVIIHSSLARAPPRSLQPPYLLGP